MVWPAAADDGTQPPAGVRGTTTHLGHVPLGVALLRRRPLLLVKLPALLELGLDLGAKGKRQVGVELRRREIRR